jgi:hypothetical protein
VNLKESQKAKRIKQSRGTLAKPEHYLFSSPHPHPVSLSFPQGKTLNSNQEKS